MAISIDPGWCKFGLNVCPTRPHPRNNVNKTIDRFKKNVMRIALFKDNSPDRRKGIYYIPTRNIKSDMWKPTKAQNILEGF